MSWKENIYNHLQDVNHKASIGFLFFKWRWQVLSFQPNTWELGLICFQRLHWLTKIDWNGFVFIGMHKRLVLRMADMVYFLPVGKGVCFTSRFVREDVFNIWTSLWPWLKTKINIVVRNIECLPSRGLTYPTLGKGKSSSKCHFLGIC